MLFLGLPTSPVDSARSSLSRINPQRRSSSGTLLTWNTTVVRLVTRSIGTNFVLQSGQRQQLFLPVSEEGTSWYVYLEFTPTGFQAKVAESLQKIRSRWVEILPEGMRTVRSAPVILRLHREDPLSKDGGVAGRCHEFYVSLGSFG